MKDIVVIYKCNKAEIKQYKRQKIQKSKERFLYRNDRNYTKYKKYYRKFIFNNFEIKKNIAHIYDIFYYNI